MRHHSVDVAVFCACLMLAACGGDKIEIPTQQTGEENLPQPNAAGGSVTGMPNPGTPSVLPQPADNLVTDNEDSGPATEVGSEIAPDLPADLLADPPTMTVEDALKKPPADTAPLMPTYPPETSEHVED